MFTSFLTGKTRNPIIILTPKKYTDKDKKKQQNKQFKSKLPSKPLPELPDDIWIEIFKLLKKPTETILKRNTQIEPHFYNGRPELGDWRNYCQEDLVNLMRVNKHFHNVVTRILYDKVIISDPYLFLYGIDHLPKDTTRLTKLQQLSEVRTVTFIYTKTSSLPQPKTTFVLTAPSLRNLDWFKVTVYNYPPKSCRQEFIKIFLTVLDSTYHATKLLEKVRMSKTQDQLIFPELQKMIIGISPFYTNDHLWLLNLPAVLKFGQHFEDQVVRALLGKQKEIGVNFAKELMYASSPREICYHSMHGPWSSLPSSAVVRSSSRKPVSQTITMILDQAILHPQSTLYIQPGTTTLWTISKNLLETYIPRDGGGWGMAFERRLVIALPRLFKKLRKIIMKSVKTFPKGTSTELTIILPVNLQSLRLAVEALRPGSRQIAAKLSKDMVYKKLEGFLMNKGVSWFRYRGLSIVVRSSEGRHFMNSSSKKCPVECRCCGLTEYI